MSLFGKSLINLIYKAIWALFSSRLILCHLNINKIHKKKKKFIPIFNEKVQIFSPFLARLYEVQGELL